MALRSEDGILKRRLGRWQIFFIALGGIIGIGFFRGSSKSLAICGPVGALIAVIVVGIVATAVMECICELVVLWPISNAMVEYVKAFVDEDLGIAVGVMYWYTYCVTFSALIIAATDLTNYWDISYIFKALIYALVPLVLSIINACPIDVFGWIEFVGGVIKLVIVIGVILLMFLINGGVGPGETIGIRYFTDGVTNNEQVASSRSQAVFEAIPLATFAYIGVELLTTTAFEARYPKELRLPAANIGWFSTVLYTIATGSFVANLSWQDRNLPQLFQQALSVITDPDEANKLAKFEAPMVTRAAPLIALYRAGFRFLPGFLNGCFIYSALSCANTALYVASRQLYGMTRTVTVDHNSGVIRSSLAWLSTINYRTKTPWPAIAISALAFWWLPFIRIRSNDEFLQDAQDALINIGSVSCLMMWLSQCLAYILFHHWRKHHAADLELLGSRWEKLFSRANGGHLRDFQPFLGYFGAVFIALIVGFFNSVSLWNGQRVPVKAISTFVSPALVMLIWLLKKFSRRDGSRFKFFRRLGDFRDFEQRIQVLEDLIYPDEVSARYGRVGHLSPGNKERLNMPHNSSASDNEGHHQSQDGTATPDRTSINFPRTQTSPYNRTNLIIKRDVQGSEEHMHSQDYEPVSPLRSEERVVYTGNGLPATSLGSRPSPASTVAQRHTGRDFLSPSSASVGPGSRRGLEEIHEMDGYAVDANTDDGISHSGSSMGWQGRM